MVPRIKRVRDIENLRRQNGEDMEPWFSGVVKSGQQANYHTLTEDLIYTLIALRHCGHAEFQKKAYKHVVEDMKRLDKKECLAIWRKMASAEACHENNNGNNGNKKGVTEVTPQI